MRPSWKNKRLGANALRAGAFDAGNQRQRERLVLRQRGGELFIKAGHGNVYLTVNPDDSFKLRTDWQPLNTVASHAEHPIGQGRAH